jgi:ATP-dependent Clp protease ATP-binding subunit ClpA
MSGLVNATDVGILRIKGPEFENETSQSKCSPVLDRWKSLIEGSYFSYTSSIKQTVTEFSSKELHTTLSLYFKKLIEEGDLDKVFSAVDRFSQSIEGGVLLEACSYDKTELLAHIQRMQEISQLSQKDRENTLIYNRLSNLSLSIYDAIHTLVNAMVKAFGIGDMFEPVFSGSSSGYETSKFFQPINSYNAVESLLEKMIGKENTTAISVIFGAIISLSILWPFISPMPRDLPWTENLTKDVEFSPVTLFGRRDAINSIADIMKVNRHAILVGPSRVGKTLTATAFARAVKEGDYPELKGKTVFKINASSLLEHPTLLRYIRENMGSHQDNIILVIDEFHTLCIDERNPITESIKSFLDEGGDFRHVIGITTDEGYATISKNEALKKRFDRVSISSTSKQETIGILTSRLLSSENKPLVDSGILNHIYDASAVNDSVQPMGALNLLKKSLQSTREMQSSPLDAEIAKAKERVNFVLQCSSLESSTSLLENLESAKAKLKLLEGKRDAREEQVKRLYKVRKVFNLAGKQLQTVVDSLKKRSEVIANQKDPLWKRSLQVCKEQVLRVVGVAHSYFSTSQQSKLNKFMMMQSIVQPCLENYLRESSKHHNICSVLSKELVDELSQSTA